MLRVLMVGLFLGVFGSAAAQDRGRDDGLIERGSLALEQIRTALSEGNFEGLTNHCSRRVDITIFGSSELLSRSQAKYVVKEFFQSYRPTQVELHETTPSDGNWFASASYWYESGESPLSIYFRLRVNDGRWELRELRIGASGER